MEERMSGTQFDVYYLAEVGYSFLMEEAFSVDGIDKLLLSSVGVCVTSPCAGRRPADPLQGEFHLSEVFTNI